MSQLLNLQLRDVRVTLPNGRQLFTVNNLEIKAGQHLLVQGESGKGKTTFLHLIAGLFLPSSGSVMIGTQNLSQLSENERCDLRREKIGVIFQKLNLLDHLTVEENIALSLPKHSKDGPARIRSALLRVRLDGRGKDRTAVLSLGEQQRVAVARVLAQGAEIILADEPTSSLDEKNAAFVMDALRDAAKDSTLIVVSHDHRIRAEFPALLSFEEFCS